MPKVDSTQTELPDLRIGSYRILQPLGLGGMSSVFRARHSETGHEVALKVLPRALAKNPTLLQRFLREAKSAESLQHPNIVSIYDRGVDQGRHYLVLEFVPGGDFHEYVQRNGPLSVADAVSVVKQVARGLDYAASRGLIHRDIKPSNLLRTPTGQVKIIDLGLAIHSENEDERVTREGTTVGTVDYMAPEQARDSRATTVQSDMYSLGCTFYFLLTGSAPFPGGDITDKLTRHAKSPPPDPQVKRPEIPDSIARIVLRLLAKNPSDRFGSYEELIADLDGIPRADRKSAGTTTAAPLSLRDLRDADFHTLSTGQDSAGYNLAAGSTVPSLLPSISLAELVADHEDSPFSTSLRAKAGSSKSPASPQLASGVISALDFDASGHDSGSTDLLVPVPEFRPALTRSEANWILGWVLTGTAAVVFVIGLDQLIRRSVVAPDVVPAATPTASRPFGGVNRSIDEQSNAIGTTDPTGRRSRSRSNSGGSQNPGNGGTPRQSWIEPNDDEPEVPPQRYYEPDTLARFVPAWAMEPVAESIGGPKIVVRRVAEPPEPSAVPTLRLGLDLAKGDLEIAGNGPFLIDDFRHVGGTRLIRARPGFRPIVQIDRPETAVREQPAIVVLSGKTLILDGLDLVVNAADFADKRPFSLFHCTDSNLTLRNCTVTVINSDGSNFSLIRTVQASGKPCRIRFEGTLVRGEFPSMIELGGAGDELVLDGSVVLGGSGPIVRVDKLDTAAEHKLSLIRSVLACRGPIVQIGGKIEPGGTKPISVRILGSAIGRFSGTGIASVIAASARVDSMTAAVDWFGEDNTFAGWKGYFATGPEEPTILVSGFTDLRSTWNSSDQSSVEGPAAWRQPADLSRAATNDLRQFLVRDRLTLSRVAQPYPFLFEKTVGSFSPPEIPQPVETGPSRSVEGSLGNSSQPRPAARHVIDAPGEVEAPVRSAPGPVVTTVLELTFSTQDPEFAGDLGLFLARKIAPDRRRARVVVRGTGTHRFTPVRLPKGLALEIVVEPPSAPNTVRPTWTPVEGSSAQPLIELTDGQLHISGIRIRVEKDSPITNIVRILDGNLLLQGCRFIRRDDENKESAPLVRFEAPTSRPFNTSSGLSILSPQLDRPVCRVVESILITDGTAFKAELGRGLLALSNSAILSGRVAFELVPTKVSRHLFESDLWLDRCTIASDRDVIRAAEWLGTRPGPDRPWLISSSNTAYLTAYPRFADETVLLRGDEDSLAHADYFWQDFNDALDVECFMSTTAAGSTAGRSRDVVLQWAHFWGPSHIRRVTGPRLSNKGPSVRFLDKLQPGKVEPADLVLDPDYYPGRTSLDLGAEPDKLGIRLDKTKPRPRR